jgi:hypothetical protein
MNIQKIKQASRRALLNNPFLLTSGSGNEHLDNRPRVLSTWLGAAIIFALNVIVCKRLFFLNYSIHMESIESVYMSISRYASKHWRDLTWCPLWYTGMPFFHVYQPGLHLMVAMFAFLTRRPIPMAYHFLTALAYSLGPVALFVLCYLVKGSRLFAFLTALVYSLFSPLNFLAPVLHDDIGGYFNPRRLQILIRYGEGPHIASLALIPVAILLLHLAMTRERNMMIALTAITMAAIAVTNWPGTIGLSMAIAAYLLSRVGQRPEMNWRVLMVTCVIGYLLISPWIPPSTIVSVQRNAQQSDNTMLGTHQILAAAVVLILCLLLHCIFRFFQVDPWVRFFAYFLILSGAVTLGYLWFDIRLLPQPHRFQPEVEMASAGLIGGVGTWALTSINGRLLRSLVIGGFSLLCLFQLRRDIQYEREQIQEIQVENRIEYRMAKAFERLEGMSRVFAPGNVSLWMNMFTEVPQVAGCCDQNVPTAENRIATFVIYSGLNAGARDTYISELWLEAYGAHAVGVTGKQSMEPFKPFVNPGKFKGALRELWRDGDDAIYEVPQRSTSLAHVINPSDVIRREPVNGLDTGPLEPYVRAIESHDYPEANFAWINEHQAQVTATFREAQLLSVQIAYHIGWHARINGRDRPTTRDALGMLVIDPDCVGECTVDLSFETTRELQWVHAAQIAVVLISAVFVLRRRVLMSRARPNLSGTATRGDS